MPIRDVITYLRAQNAREAIHFYEKAFGAVEKFRLVEPSSRIGHCELLFGDTIIMISDEFPEADILAPAPSTLESVAIHLRVDYPEETIDRAVGAGATLIEEPENRFYGERAGTVRDPFGYYWIIGRPLETIDPVEMQRRYTAIFDGCPSD